MKKITAVVFFFVFVLGASFVLADFDRARWEYKKPVSISAGGGFVLLDLDREVFARAKGGLADLRVVADSGREVPYVLVAEGSRVAFETLPARVSDKTFVRGESTRFIVDLGSAGLFHNRLVIHTSSENFRRMVEIEASNDRSTWRYLTTRGQIFDYNVRDQKPVSVEDTSIDYPESTARYLRVTIRDAGEAPLVINSVSVSRMIEKSEEAFLFDSNISTAKNQQDRTTEVTADLGSKGIPTNRVQLAIKDVFFSRRIDVAVSDEKDKGWRFVGSDYIYRINTLAFTGERAEIRYPETQARYIRISIHDGDDAALSIDSAKFFGVVRRIAFQSDVNSTYMLFYGNPDARRPEYDIARLYEYTDVVSMNRAELGREERNSDFKEKEKPLTERNPYLLPTALGIIVAILAFFGLRVISKTTPPASPAA